MDSLHVLKYIGSESVSAERIKNPICLYNKYLNAKQSLFKLKWQCPRFKDDTI